MYQGTVSGMNFSGYFNFSHEIYLYYSLHIFYWFYFLPKEMLAKILLKCILRVCVVYNNEMQMYKYHSDLYFDCCLYAV